MIQSGLTELWYFDRPHLAASIVEHVSHGRAGRVALFGARRTGKTTLLRREAMPEAESHGFVAVYADCWHDRANPISGLNYALEQAIARIEVPASKVGRRLATEVRRVSVVGLALEFGPEPDQAAPDSAYLRFDWLIARLLARARKPVFFVIDEAQAIADAAEADRIAAAIRTAFTKYEAQVRVVLTGSSELKLAKLLARTQAPLYNFMPRVQYEPLGDAFVAHVCACFERATNGRRLDATRAVALLDRLGRQPAAFLAAVEAPLADPTRTLDDGVEQLLAPQMPSPMTAAWEDCTLLQRATLVATAAGVRLTSDEGLRMIGGMVGTGRATNSSVARAIGALEERHLVDRDVFTSHHARYVVADPIFALWLERNAARLMPVVSKAHVEKAGR